MNRRIPISEGEMRMKKMLVVFAKHLIKYNGLVPLQTDEDDEVGLVIMASTEHDAEVMADEELPAGLQDDLTELASRTVTLMVRRPAVRSNGLTFLAYKEATKYLFS